MTLESTRNMKTLCEESQQIGIKTLENLEHQGEQLKRVNEGLDEMRSEMRQTEKSLNRMEKFCGFLCICPSFKSEKIKDHKSQSKAQRKSRPKGSTVPDKVSSAHCSKSSFFVQKFNFDKTPTFSRVFHPNFF